MTYIETVPQAEASGEVLAMYEQQSDRQGRVPDYARIYSHNPELMSAWAQLSRALRGATDRRAYLLANFGAARAMKNSACALAFGEKLVADGLSREQLEAAATGHGETRLSAVENAVLELAGKVACDATAVEREDIDGLRELGLSDSDIFHVAANAAARCFFAKLADSLGVRPEGEYPALGESLAELLGADAGNRG